MARDVVIDWKSTAPENAEIEASLCSYVGEAKAVMWSEDRWFAIIHGVSETRPEEQRWIEVWPSRSDPKACLYVMTRGADDLTNAVADGFAKRCARLFDGAIQET